MKIILLILLLVFSIPIQAHWNGWDSPFAANGVVTGSWRFDTPLNIRSTTSPQLRLTHTVGADSLIIGVDANGYGSAISSGSRFGINTATPDYTLHVAGNISVDANIYHNEASSDTRIVFEDDQITVRAGNVRMQTWDEAGVDLVHINQDNLDHDFKVGASGQANAISVNGANGNVGIGVLVSGVQLTVEGGFSIGDTTGFVLSSAAATITSESNVILDTEAAAALDTVTTLTGVIGQIIYISSRVDARDVRFLDAGNFLLGGERTLNTASDVLVLKATSATTWKEVSYIDN